MGKNVLNDLMHGNGYLAVVAVVVFLAVDVTAMWVCKRAAMMQSCVQKQQNQRVVVISYRLRATRKRKLVNHGYIRCNGERWASPYFAATVTSERTENDSARQSERGRCIQVHIHNKNVQWVSGCCVNCAGACIHILNSWRCTIAYFVYLSWISWNENTHRISKHTVPFHSLSPITITIIFS